MELDEPELRDVPLTAILAALADENRLSVVRELADGSERACGTFVPEWSKATRSHHLKVLREAGLTRTRVVGTTRLVTLRRADMATAYPGLLEAVLAAETAPRAERA